MRGFKKVSVLMLSLFVCLMMVVPATAAPNRCRVLIGFEGQPSEALVRGMGGKVIHSYKIVPAIAAEIPEAAISALAANPRISYVELDHKVQALQQTLPWGVDRIDAEVVHPYNKGTGVKVCIIDTGIDYNHPDLDANYVDGIDYANKDADPMDDNGHGTHCAGIVAAEDNIEGVVGVAPEASLYAVKALDSSGSGYVSDVAAGIDWAVDNGMDVISMSLGSDLSSLTLENACNNAYASGLILVAAAGNDGNPAGKTDSVDYPARYDSVIAVAATNDADTRATWSSTGPDVELSAPGVGIDSTYLDGGYATGSGTSMACPHVVGTVALAKIAYSDYTNVEIRSLLQNTADDLGAVGLDIKYGYGLVDADEVAPDVGPDVTPPTISDLTPADGSVISTGSPTISAVVSDATGIDGDSIVMTVDETAVVHTYDSTTGIVSYALPDTGPLAEGSHTVTLDVDDTLNNSTRTSWSFTVDTTSPINEMHVASIEMSTWITGINTAAIATVTIVDADGNPVEGVTVYGQWSGLTSDSDIGATDAGGQVSLASNRIKRANGTFVFTVDDVVLNGWTYDVAANVETSDSITVP